MPQVFKFGGASIQDADAIRHLASLLEAHPERPLIVVVSAMGKTTNALEALLAAARTADGEADYRQRLERLRAEHLAVVEALFGDTATKLTARLDELLAELDAAHHAYRDAPYPLHYDQTVCYGELLSTTLVAAWLNHRGLATDWRDARGLIITDDHHQDANIDWPATAEAVRSLDLGSGRLLITQGFIGGTTSGRATTLGREGSDFTAAILANCLESEAVTIWKDVPGVLNADPRRFANASQLTRIGYAEAIELSWHGAKVIHPKTLAPLQAKRIPLAVRSFVAPELPPSLIGPESDDEARPASYILRDDQSLLRITPRDHAFMDEAHLHAILGHCLEAGIHATLLDREAVTLKLCTPQRARGLETLLTHLAADYRVSREDDLTLLTVRHPGPGVMDTLGTGRDCLAERFDGITAQRLFRSDQCPETWQIPD